MNFWLFCFITDYKNLSVFCSTCNAVVSSSKKVSVNYLIDSIFKFSYKCIGIVKEDFIQRSYYSVKKQQIKNV